ncbi:MAG: hypothetical protein SOT46_09305 [Treponema sp.]|nr:hypothetical protein [Treponema sp.]
MKKIFIFNIFFALTTLLTAQSNQIKFIKGNLNDKTQAVRQSEGDESIWLIDKTLDFALENISLLRNDRDLEGLVVAAVLSISSENVENYSFEQKTKLSNQLISVFNNFENSNTVIISVVNKLVSLRAELPTEYFSHQLNNFIKNVDINKVDSGVMRAVLNAASLIGNNETFYILFDFLGTKKYVAFENEITAAVSELVPVSINETLDIINNGTKEQLALIFDILTKNQKIPKNILCEIAENVLNKSILLVEDSSKVDSTLIDIQLSSIDILSSNKWTRASTIGLNFFKLAKGFYKNNFLSETQFCNVISSLSNIAPIDSISALIAYLEELNSQKENFEEVNSNVVLSVINTLGAIGDKTAFDTLLAVTYINYPENVLTAARDALAGLRW